jgi:CRP/FNR family cyclic AMP-dependent transcriptional regulator
MNDPRFHLAAFLSGADGRGTLVAYRKGEVVFCQGDEADAVFYVLDGNFKVSILSQRGKEAVISLPKKGEFFGESCLKGQRQRIATVSAITRAKVLRISKSTTEDLMCDESEFSELFISHLLKRNARLKADLVDHLFNSSERRLARVLLLMANFGKEGAAEPEIPKISQETLAEMIGTTRSRVSFFMNKFRKLGFIEYKGNIKIHSSLLNVVLHDDPAIWEASVNKT